MNIVYKLTFENRKKSNLKPFYYIGSKSNCQVKNGEIREDKGGKAYFGSSKYKNYNKIVEENKASITVEILFISENYVECLKKEREAHLSNDVVMSPDYFNLSIAMDTTYSNPEFGTMRNVESGKVCRVRLDYQDVIGGLWVGVSKGFKWYNDGVVSKLYPEGCQPHGWTSGRLSGKRFGDKNHFFGRRQDEKSIRKGVETRRERGSYIGLNKGRVKQPISEETKLKMSNSHTGKHRGELNPSFGKKWITNGVTNQMIPKTDLIPEGWRLGQTRKK